MNPQPKKKPLKNPAYLSWIRKQKCEVCWRIPTQAHHVRREYWGAGTGIKPHDYVSIALCAGCHNPDVEKLLKIESIIIKNLVEYAREKYGDRALIESLMAHIEERRGK